MNPNFMSPAVRTMFNHIVDKYQENYERMESRLKTDNASHDKITKQYEDAQAKLDKIQQKIDALNKK